MDTTSSPCNPRLLHYQSKDKANALGLASSTSFTNLSHRPHYSNGNSEQSEKISSSIADLNKEFSSSLKINFNSINKNNVNESEDNNNNTKKNNLNESKIEAKNSTLKNLTSFSQIVYQSRVKHFVNAVEANKASNNGTDSVDLTNSKTNINNKFFQKTNNSTNDVLSILNAPSNSCRLNVVKPKQTIDSHFDQRSNEVEYQADRRLSFYFLLPYLLFYQ